MPSKASEHTAPGIGLDGPPGRLRRRRVARVLRRLLAAVVILILAVFALLETDAVLERSGRWALERFNPFVGARLSFEDVSGGAITGLRIRNLRLTDDSGKDLARVEDAFGEIRLLPLLRGDVSITRLDVLRPSVTMSQLPDSTWDLINVLPADTAESSTRVTLRNVSLNSGRAEVAFLHAAGDSVLKVHDLSLVLDRFESPTTAVDVDSLYMLFSPPRAADTVRALASVSYEDMDLVVRRLSLGSALSRVESRGRLSFTGTAADFDDLDFSLSAIPLAFRDVAAFVPALNPDGVMEVRSRAVGSSETLDVDGELQFGDGGSARIRGTASPPTAAVVSHRLSVNVDAVDPRYVFRSADPGAPVTARLELDVGGPSTDSLSGSVQLTSNALRYSDYRITGARATAQLDNGHVDLDAAATVNGARLAVDASGRPLDDQPTYRGALRFESVNVARLRPGSTTESDLNGRATVDLRGKTFQTMTGRVNVDMLGSTWSGARLSEGRAAIRLREGTVNLDFAAAADGGRIDGAAILDLADPVTYTIRSLNVRELDLASFTADTTTSSVNVRISGSGRGLDVQRSTASLEFAFDSTSYGTYRLESGAGRLRLTDGRVDLNADLNLRGGSAAVEASARPFDRWPTIEVTSARFDSLNLSLLTGAPSWETNLAGSLSGQIQLHQERTSGRATLRLDTSTVNEQIIEAADLVARVERESLDAELTVSIPGGRFAFEADGNPFAESPRIEITNGSIAGVDVSKILGVDGIRTDLNGRFEARTEGLDPATAVASARLELRGSIVNDETLTSGFLTAVSDSGRVAIEVESSAGDGHVELRGSAGPGLDPWEFVASTTSISPARLAGLDSLSSVLNLNLSMSGRGTNGELVEGDLGVRDSAIGSATVSSAAARFRFEGGRLQLDTLYVASNFGSIQGGGSLSVRADSTAPDSDFRLLAQIDELQPLAQLVPDIGQLVGTGTIDATAVGDPASQRFRIDGQFRRLAFGDLRIGELRLRTVGRLGDGLSIQDVEGRAEAEQPSLPNIAARTARVDAAFRDGDLRFEAVSVVDDRRDIRTAGIVSFGGPEPILTLESLRFGPPSERWELLTESQISLGDEYRVSNFLLYSDRQQVAVDGYIDLDGEQSLVVSIEEVRIGVISEFFGYGGLDGRVNGYIDLTGRADSPRILGSITANITSLGTPVGDLSAELDYADMRVQVDARLRDKDGKTLTATGFVPVDWRLAFEEDGRLKRFGGAASAGETDLTVAADGFAIGWIKPFLDPTVYSDIGGRLAGQVEIGGTFEQPTVEGTATVTQGLLGLTEFKVIYRNIRVDARFVNDVIYIDHVEAASGGGSMIASGTVSLDDLNLGDFNITISTEDFLAVDNREYQVSTAADLVLTGTTVRPNLTGTVEVTRADIILAEEIEEFDPIRLSTQDLLTVEQRFGIRLTERDTTTFDFYEALTMDLVVRMSRNTWLRSKKNPTMDIQFTGSLDVNKRPFEDPQMFGSIEVLPERSRIVQFGKAFAIKKGDLTYNGPIEDPVLDIEAEYAIRAWRNPDAEVTITLSASGTLADLDVELSSDPTMELTDIVSYIAFGRPASESLHLGGGGQGGALATNIALGQVANLIEGVAGSGLGLDVVEIEQQGLDTRLTAGKYVHSRLYLSISQPLSLSGSTSGTSFGSQREITAEFEMLQSLLLRLLSRRGSISVNLLWQYAY